MRESWRWFGPDDTVTLDHIRQAGATDIVTALHHIDIGEVWPLDEIIGRKNLIENVQDNSATLEWTVVESVPVHDDIKRGADGCDLYTANFVSTLQNLAQAGVKVVCYNFMPVIDWTRTDLKFPLPSGALALRFDQDVFAAFDLFILRRKEADLDYNSEEIKRAQDIFTGMTSGEIDQLTNNIISGLPGKMTCNYSLDDFRAALENYKTITKDDLRRNLLNFMDIVIPEAENLNVKLTIHPDDPPRDMFGLPRIVCTAHDLDFLFKTHPSPSNGLALCVGTFGSRPDNDLPNMVKQFGNRIYFAHLRGVQRDTEDPRSFTEAAHLDSDIDMVAVIRNLLSEERGRGHEKDGVAEIYIRPDHGHQILDDLQKTANPGYSAIGRLKGLAEIRGVIRALQRTMC